MPDTDMLINVLMSGLGANEARTWKAISGCGEQATRSNSNTLRIAQELSLNYTHLFTFS